MIITATRKCTCNPTWVSRHPSPRTFHAHFLRTIPFPNITPDHFVACTLLSDIIRPNISPPGLIYRTFHSIWQLPSQFPSRRAKLCSPWAVFSERELKVHVRYMSSSVRLSVVRLSSVCLLSVTFVRPTQTIEIFGNVLRPVVPWSSVTFV